MSISVCLLETIQNQFEVFCIRVLQNEARDCYRELVNNLGVIEPPVRCD